jgi:hypothetical protein
MRRLLRSRSSRARIALKYILWMNSLPGAPAARTLRWWWRRSFTSKFNIQKYAPFFPEYRLGHFFSFEFDVSGIQNGFDRLSDMIMHPSRHKKREGTAPAHDDVLAAKPMVRGLYSLSSDPVLGERWRRTATRPPVSNTEVSKVLMHGSSSSSHGAVPYPSASRKQYDPWAPAENLTL